MDNVLDATSALDDLVSLFGGSPIIYAAIATVATVASTALATSKSANTKVDDLIVSTNLDKTNTSNYLRNSSNLVRVDYDAKILNTSNNIPTDTNANLLNASNYTRNTSNILRLDYDTQILNTSMDDIRCKYKLYYGKCWNWRN